MRKLLVYLPQNYKEYELKIMNVDFIFEEPEKADVVIYYPNKASNIGIEQYAVLDVKDINQVVLNDKDKEVINKFLVYDIDDYENLAIKFNITKKKILLIDTNNATQFYNSLFNNIYNELKEKLYDIQFSLDAEKWLSDNNNLKIYSEHNKLVFEDRMTDKPYYIAYEMLGSFSNHKLWNFKIDNDKAYKTEFDYDFEGNISCELFIIELSNDEKIDTHTIGMKNIKYFTPSEKTRSIRIAIRISGQGKIIINKIKFAEIKKDNYVEEAFQNDSKSQFILLTNIYPSKENLYRNAFVHRRVKKYAEVGLIVDVFTLKKDKHLSIYTFDNIRVFSGNEQTLLDVFRCRDYKKILIHFVNQDMIKAIDKFSVNIPKIVWIHGVEALSWERRKCNYLNISNQEENELNNKDKVKHQSLIDIVANKTYKFVFVSNWLKKAVEEDIGTKITNYEIIPNVIDTNIFKYRKKPIEHRKKILSIRPYTANNYANDLTAKVILELSKKEFFKELTFTLYGKGPLFKETVEPLRKFENVSLNETFLTQEEISKLHRKHGLFLCPTRADTQGVSIGEAMASGLVPITNKVQAIPEFVDQEVGMLAENENYRALAQGIERIYNNAELFGRLSKHTVKRVGEQCGGDKTILREIEITNS